MCTSFQVVVAWQAYAPQRGTSVHRWHIFHHETNEASFCACRTRTCPIQMCRTQIYYRNDSALRPPSALRPSLSALCPLPSALRIPQSCNTSATALAMLHCAAQSAIIIMMHLTNHKCDIHAAQGLPCLFVLPSSQDYNNGTKKSAHHSLTPRAAGHLASPTTAPAPASRRERLDQRRNPLRPHSHTKISTPPNPCPRQLTARASFARSSARPARASPDPPAPAPGSPRPGWAYCLYSPNKTCHVRARTLIQILIRFPLPHRCLSRLDPGPRQTAPSANAAASSSWRSRRVETSAGTNSSGRAAPSPAESTLTPGWAVSSLSTTHSSCAG